MASSAVVDPLQTLQAALTVQANSKEQADILDSLKEYLEAQPALIPVLAGTLVGQVVNGGDSLLKSWVFNLLHFSICRSALSQDVRTTLSSQSLDSLAQLLGDPNPALVKVAIQTLTTVYPLLFRLLCTTRSNPAAWETLTRCKVRILEFLWSPKPTAGMRLSAMKFMQRVILVQTRGVSDPRLQNKNDPNISFCPADHPFLSVPTLEQEGQRLFDGVVNIFMTSQNVDLLTAVLNSWSTFVKLRPLHAPKVITTLKQWSPDILKGQSANSIKSVEKAIRIFLIHISRIPAYAQYGAIIGEVLTVQGARMDAAAAEERKRKAAAAESRKRATSASAEHPPEAKRAKLEPEETPLAATPSSSSTTPSPLASFDFTTLPASLITDLIVANLDAFTEVALVDLIQNYRTSNNIGAESKVAGPSKSTPPPPPPTTVKPSVPSSSPLSAPPVVLQNELAAVSTPPPVVVKEEPIDPMQMDIDQDEIEYEPEQLNLELSGDVPQVAAATAGADVSPETLDLQLVEFKLPPPKDLDEEERITLLRVGVSRIWTGADEARQGADVTHADPAQDMWILLIIRMITRAAEQPDDGVQLNIDGKAEEDSAVATLESRHDRLRQILCDYIMADFPSRIRLATTWMNEEWYNDRIRTAKDHSWRPNYDIWLHQIVVSYQTLLDGKDRTFGRFLLDLPMIPSDVLNLLRDQCLDNESPERMQVGFTTLRGFVIQRPSLRGEALNALLELTTHPEKKIRGAAINTVKIWVPNSQPMDTMIREFALQMLRRLQLQPSKPVETTKSADGDEKMEDGQLPLEDLIQTPFLPEKVELPAEKSQILQHVELLFALSVKVPDFLDEIFAAYGSMDVTVQKAIQELITALIRSLGPNHGKLLTLMRTCPPGAESLALRVLTIFTEHGRPSAQLVALVKGLISERDLDARFLIPIIAEMDKADIMRYLPRIVSILNGEAEPKNLVRSVFSSVVTTPPQTFGSVTSNLPRVRQSELLTPAELMVLLHDSEKEIGLKSAIEAIGICFSMTDVFRSEILAVVMQQIMDEPILPVLFLRTVIQAVKTYKSLIGFVSTTLLSRLITKKIWTNPPLWEGFIRCAKVIAPASFSALLQLPKDQLRELVDKQPSLKSGLRDYVIKKAPNKARGAGYLDIFGEGEDNNDSSTPQASTPVPQPEPSLAAPAA
ncbi:hypothetical protein BDN71DRAFT_1441725 [Pleurotus eryngii]|uniref:Symplekin n=1 Tax=Pleurotus eryngii TaxID=5323 RepID=A0A9P6DAS0_PLEER|nr:hypothetical protein BDN71DRAFT_1441725 [Pleurotus eryngii]